MVLEEGDERMPTGFLKMPSFVIPSGQRLQGFSFGVGQQRRSNFFKVMEHFSDPSSNAVAILEIALGHVPVTPSSSSNSP